MDKNRLKPLIALAAAAALLVLARGFDIQRNVRGALAWIEGLGAWGPAAFTFLYILSCVLFVPGSLLTLGAGALFGVALGTVTVSIASTLGASAAFLIGRHLARDWVARRIGGDARFAAVDQAVGREGWKIVLLVRLSPLFPFNLVNYAFGLTSVSFRHYFFASWAGMLPATVMYVYLGSLAGALARLGTGGAARTPAQWGLYAVGLAATVAATVFITRLARAALAEKL